MTQHLLPPGNINSFKKLDVTSTNSETFSFPKSSHNLWDTTALDDAISFGIKEYNPFHILCLERCLRLAHRHSAQSNEQGKFHGFLLGSSHVNGGKLKY